MCRLSKSISYLQPALYARANSFCVVSQILPVVVNLGEEDVGREGGELQGDILALKSWITIVDTSKVVHAVAPCRLRYEEVFGVGSGKSPSGGYTFSVADTPLLRLLTC